MKIIFLIITVVVLTVNAQRGSYAGSSPIINGIKRSLLNQQYPDSIDNRFNDDSAEDNLNSNFLPFYPQSSYNSNQLVNRINQLPDYKQPFWFQNRDYINSYLNSNPQAHYEEFPFYNPRSFDPRRRF